VDAHLEGRRRAGRRVRVRGDRVARACSIPSHRRCARRNESGVGADADISSTDPDQFAALASSPGSIHEVSFYIGSGVSF